MVVVILEMIFFVRLDESYWRMTNSFMSWPGIHQSCDSKSSVLVGGVGGGGGCGRGCWLWSAQEWELVPRVYLGFQQEGWQSIASKSHSHCCIRLCSLTAKRPPKKPKGCTQNSGRQRPLPRANQVITVALTRRVWATKEGYIAWSEVKMKPWPRTGF